MPRNQPTQNSRSRNKACQICWLRAKQCNGGVNCRCSVCSSMMAKLKNNGTDLNFPLKESQSHMYDMYRSLESQDLEFSKWIIKVERRNKPNTTVELPSYGTLDNTDGGLQTADLDNLILSQFAPKLRAKSGNPAVIANAVLASGYIFCLLSATNPSQPVSGMVNGSGNPCSNETLRHTPMFKGRLLMRLGAISDLFRASFRHEIGALSQNEAANNHAAAVIFLHGMVDLYEGLHNGVLQSLFPTELTERLSAWSNSFRDELYQQAGNDCSKFWNDALKGPLKQLKIRRKEHVRMTVELQQYLRSLDDSIEALSESPGLLYNESGISFVDSAMILPPTPFSMPTAGCAETSAAGFEDYNNQNFSWSGMPTQHPQYSAPGFEDHDNQNVSWPGMPVQHPQYSANAYYAFEQMATNDKVYSNPLFEPPAQWASHDPGEFFFNDRTLDPDPSPYVL
ncbi:uncharacterized protein LY89DRAFT_782373 [Mollisia scopiformis]|uniref:Uncharacterized protein n=1 Tax=Mollisia scopiformis TaxID=149040 RepID=A0A194XAM0_MOLSC|nr:uncharacterized protein LY89DRAFT_782373 [Mollisia scopiformis]KUJ17189.1 hypothetical protein LY89DRAFT_782373 [Mollisia scopiformis]